MTETPETLFNQLEHLMIADPVEAVNLARAEISRIDSLGNISDRIRLRRLLVMALSHSSRFDDALEVFHKAEELSYAGEAPKELARIRLASMQPLAHLGRTDEAISAGEQARTDLEALGSSELAGRASLNIGAIQAMTGHHQQALDSFDHALSRLQNDALLAGQIQTNRGTALAALEQFEAAEEAFSAAGNFLGSELPWASAVIEENLGGLAARQGAINQSLRHYEAARRHLEQEEAFGDLGRVDAEEAIVLSMMGMTSLATDRFERSGALLMEHGTPADLALAQLGYGRALADAGELDKAQSLLQSIAASIDEDESPGLFRQYLQLAAHIAIEKEDWSTATSIITSAKESVGERPIQQASLSVLEAKVALAEGDVHRATQLLENTLQRARAAHVSPLIANIHELLSSISRVHGKDDEADDHARAAIMGYEAIRGTIHADQMRRAWHHGRLNVYGDFAITLMQRPDRDSQAEAFEIVERIRSRSLLDAVQQGASGHESRIPMNTDEVPLIEELDQHQRWLNWTYSSLAMGQELSDQQQSELAEREQAALRLADRLATMRPGFGFHQPIDLTSVQTQLNDDAVLLSYLVVDEVVTLQVITRNSIHGFTNLLSASELSEMVSAMQFQVGRALVSGTSTVSPRREARLKRDMDLVLEQLYEALILPAESLLAGKRHCLVIPSGDLHSVPFAALRRNNQYLTIKLSFSTAPSVSVLSDMTVRGEGRFAPKQPLIVGVSDDAAPGLGEEASRLVLEIVHASLLLNELATRNAVVNALPQADLVHMACHGRFDPKFPTASGLQVADGWLTLDDFRQTRINQALMVLSGCETGRARIDQGDDLVGLMTALVASGAGALVTSMWKTHDEAALALILAFYAALRQGKTVAEALRSSQMKVQSTFAHPAMWAPFVGISKRRGWLA